MTIYKRKEKICESVNVGRTREKRDEYEDTNAIFVRFSDSPNFSVFRFELEQGLCL